MNPYLMCPTGFQLQFNKGFAVINGYSFIMGFCVLTICRAYPLYNAVWMTGNW